MVYSQLHNGWVGLPPRNHLLLLWGGVYFVSFEVVMKLVEGWGVGWGGHTWQYGVSLGDRVTADVRKWCLETFDADRCYVGNWNVAFNNEADRNWFMLRWS